MVVAAQEGQFMSQDSSGNLVLCKMSIPEGGLLCQNDASVLTEPIIQNYSAVRIY